MSHEQKFDPGRTAIQNKHVATWLHRWPENCTKFDPP